VFVSCCYPYGSEIFTIKQDSTQLTRITNNTWDDDGPSWSHDGKKIVFTSFINAPWEIYVMNSDGGNMIKLTNHPAYDVSPTWSSDDSQIIFVSWRDSNTSEIFAMNNDGSDVSRLTNNLGWNEYPDCWP